jgi:16S rRNA (cytidine1402-2'-O)-methyltransferase
MERLLTESHSGKLYVVASPIGHAQDLSPRALETLRTADLVLAEDTRSARKLLDGHGKIGRAHV